ncbi:6-phosphogluconolactonase [Mucilaginibacter terrae]|uniref:6-phosphogluconolactonase n=1 Tax=Mucilaginibacter terrae TaxID=1955052 RepID=A0ABU3H006_9SPHI|nr:6-phosphogluconolactonase [Mucilaginibacter terrae]MDT3405349.1 6-phosphogluconolactonase [Mucilaginibacter terrae]
MMLKVFDNKEEISATAAQLFIDIAQKAVSERGRFTVALTGGTSPDALYTLLSSPAFKDKVDWAHTFIFWGDERWVPLTDDKSNAKMAHRTLLSNVPIPESQIFYMWADGKSPEEFAQEYEQQVRQVLGDALSFDLVLLGMGGEGHTASLFPYEPVLKEKDKLVYAYFLASQDMFRVTLTAPLINKAQNIVVMLLGESKAAALHEVLEGEHNPELYPAQLLNPENGKLLWLVDQAAAKDLKGNYNS